jgi:hypothetical protein
MQAPRMALGYEQHIAKKLASIQIGSFLNGFK